MYSGGLNNVLILENDSGHVYIVEGQECNNKLQKYSMQIDKKEVIFEEVPESENLDISSIKDEPDDKIIEEHLDESLIESQYQVPFVDVQPEEEEDIEIKLDPASFLDPPRNKPKPPENPFCKYCDEKFKSRNELWMHICRYLECDPENFICKICLEHVSKKEFNNHVHELLMCKHCGKQFLSDKSLDAHCDLMHASKTATNESEDENVQNKINSMNQLLRRKGFNAKKDRNHPNHRSKRKQKLECDICGKYLVSLKSLEYHMNLHRGHTNFICSSCGEKFFTPNGIRAHKCDKKRKRPEIDFRTNDMRHCRFCDQRFSSFDENKAHTCDYAHPDDPKMIICRCCGKVLNKLAFNRHMEIHSGVNWVCGICQKNLATQRALKVHMTTHSGNRPYKCKLCSESFINKVVLDRHMRFHGHQPKTFNCEFCFKQLSSDTSLRSHIQRVHSNSFQCELCKDTFENKENLKNHLQASHPPSDCKVCGKTFALPRYLKMHMKLHYDSNVGTKINCQICSKSQLMRNLKNHVYRHHVEQFDRWCKDYPSFLVGN